MMDTHGMKKAAQRGSQKSAEPSKDEQLKNGKILTPDEAVRSALGPFAAVIKNGLPKGIDPVDFTGALITEVLKSPKLIRAVKECPESLIGAAIQAKQLGFELNSQIGQCHLIPYFEIDKVASESAGRKVYKMRVSLQFGYQGTMKLCYNSGEVVDVDAMEVYEKDFFDYRYGMKKNLDHVPYVGADRGYVKCYYAIVNLKTGGTVFRVWSVDQVEEHAIKFSKSWSEERKEFSGPWKSSFNSMAKKTVLLDVLKYIPKSADFSARLNSDNTTKSVSADEVNIDMLTRANEEYIDGVQAEAVSVESVEKQVSSVSAEANPQSAKEVADGIRSQFNLKRGTEIKGAAQQELDPAFVS